MLKIRQDAWSEENDLLLAETVLRHVREGSTQLNAFEEVGDILNRTSAACGFRWNAVVRHDYEKALQMARRYRKDQQRSSQGDISKKRLLYHPPMTLETENLSSNYDIEDEVEREEIEEIRSIPASTVISSPTTLTLSHVISYLQSIRDLDYRSSSLQVENQQLQKENERFKHQISDLELKVKKLEKESSTVQEDYEALINIMNRARKMVLLEEEQHAAAPSFRMDRNGNLERIAE